MKMRIYLFILLSITCTYTWAQPRQVTGRVTKESSTEPVSSATVRLKGGETITRTDTAGNFTISVPNNSSVLVFSSVGFGNTEVAVGNRSVLEIYMPQTSSTLDDIVVVGYGTARKRDITGAIASLPGSTLERIPVSSVAEALTGRLAGVQVTTTDGAPGAEIVIRVRGGGSVTQDNSPLYIVDGFPVSNINDIATTDIVNIDILKDASSTAIYGARGANGVVIVTTKSAKGGKTVVSFNSYFQGRTLPKKLEVMSPYEFVLAQYEYARIRSQSEVDNFSKYFGVYDDLELYKAQKGTDWQEELFGGVAISQQHNVSLTGGTDKTKFSFSVTNNDDEGILVGSGYNRTYMNFKLSHEISSKLKFDMASRFTNTITDGAGTSGGSSLRISDGINTRPVNGIADQIIIDPTGPDDDYEQFLKSLVNPVELAAQDYRKKIDKSFNNSVALSWNILSKLIFRSDFTLNLSYGDSKRYYGPLTGESKNNGGNLPLGEITQYNNMSYRWANTLVYWPSENSYCYT